MQRGVFVFAARESASEREAVNSSRLTELERQRALVHEQLVWLEREIAREKAVTPAVSANAFAGRPRADAPNATTGPASTGQNAGPLGEVGPLATTQPAVHASAFDEYQPDPKNAALNARRGCLFAAGGAFVLLLAAFVALYFYRYSDRPILLPSHAEAAKK